MIFDKLIALRMLKPNQGRSFLDLLDAIHGLHRIIDEHNCCSLPAAYYRPGFLVALASYLDSRSVNYQSFDCHSDNAGYFDAIGLSLAIWDVDDYPYQRVGCGSNYSMMTRLNSADNTDRCTTDINNCLRNMTPNRSDGFSNLTHVVGELHDNVWSHGMGTGFSLAQKYQVPFSNGQDYYLEFALADSGLGYLREMKRAGFDIESHQEAIDWCVREGNSTKHSDTQDEWAQTVPADLAGGSPMSYSVGTRVSANHHQGLGLDHLLRLVKGYSGELDLVSGNATLSIDSNGRESFSINENTWQGVVLSCRIKESCLNSAEDYVSESQQNIMDRLISGG